VDLDLLISICNRMRPRGNRDGFSRVFSGVLQSCPSRAAVRAILQKA